MKRLSGILVILLISQASALARAVPGSSLSPSSVNSLPPWLWAIILFAFCFGLGILAILAGIGGGVLFVPLVGSFFPFHMDFVRGASFFVTLAGSLSASSGLLDRYLASTRLVFPLALLASSAAVVGAKVGLSLPEHIVRMLLGVLILLISALMLLMRQSEYPEVNRSDALSRLLCISGCYNEHTLGRDIEWKTHRTLPSMLLFLIIGFIAGMFGIGAGWANVPVLNLLMGVPLKVSVGSSLFIISIGSTAPSWIYLNAGAVLPLIAVPSVLGMILGSRIGVRVLHRTEPRIIRHVVIALLALSGIMSVLRGIGVL
jgi:uncharacterized membrane protein YfcA